MFDERIGAVKEKTPPKLGSLSMFEYLDKLQNYAHGNRLGLFWTLGAMGQMTVHTTARSTTATHQLLGEVGRAMLHAEAEVKISPS